jgi:hypothetical protein
LQAGEATEKKKLHDAENFRKFGGMAPSLDF